LLLARLEPPRSDASARNVQPSVAEAPAIADLPAGGR
ncbi:MAG: hypothetical protein JWN08_3431, partial [Frankiales bacterium]|nr:hypothetical protein [Frankiales bacterium]